MDKRSEILQQFGPKLLEGLFEMLLAEVNEIRTALSLPPRTKAQAYDQLTNHFSNLPDYDWMEP